MKKPDPINDHVYTFQHLKFVEDKFREKEKLDPTLVHPLHLTILKHLGINPVIPSFLIKIPADCVIKVPQKEIENFYRLRTLSIHARSFIKMYLEIIEEKQDNYEELTTYEKVNLIRQKDEKTKTLFLQYERFSFDPKAQTAFYNGLIDYLNIILQKNPEDFKSEKLLHLITRERNSWEQLIINPNPEQPAKDNGKTEIPYKIALLNEIGFFNLPQIRNLTKTNQRQLLRQLIGGTDRQLKGNINVLDPHSDDNRLRYTSGTYEVEVKQYISTLSNKKGV